jgi:hypothetical protein
MFVPSTRPYLTMSPAAKRTIFIFPPSKETY